ncbi:MAG: GNAT family N-acetyltransferase, partial [Thermoplasmata archaeon]
MASPEKKADPFRFRRLGKPEEFRQLEEVQSAAFGSGPEGALTVPLQRALQDNGGLVLGAFVDIYLVGFTIGFLGWDGRRLYHYSHMTAVRPEYQNHQVGLRLKRYQREEVLAMGLEEVRWTFDPLRSRNARLNVRRLGARPASYLPHYYGRLDDAANHDLETDRLRLVWRITSPTVVDRLEGKLPTKEQDHDRWISSSPIIQTEPGESGIRVP